MPIIYINFLEGRDEDKKRKLVEAVTKAVSESIDTPIENVKIILSEMALADYAIGGKLIKDIKNQ